MRPHQGVVAVLHIPGQHGVAIVEAGLAPQAEGGTQPVGRHAHILGQQAVAGSGFIQRPGQQRVEHQPRQIRRGRPLDGERVVLVERGSALVAHQPDFAALGGLGVDVVQVGKAGRVFQVTPQRIAVRSPGGSHAQPNEKCQTNR